MKCWFLLAIGGLLSVSLKATLAVEAIVNDPWQLIEKKLSFDEETETFVRNRKEGRIAGLSAVKNQFPWQALLILDDSYSCGGSLISPSWILTAAHCLYDVTNVTVILGTLTRGNGTLGSQVFKTNAKFVHESFVDYNLNNDIALLKLPLEANIAGPHVSTVRLPRVADADKNFVGVQGVVSGWGKTGDALPPSETLKYVSRKVVGNKECLKAFNAEIVTPQLLCIQNGDNKGTCSGDSGGPFVYKEKDGVNTQIGVVSFGSLEGCFKKPSGFTRVASYLEWIARVSGIAKRN